MPVWYADLNRFHIYAGNLPVTPDRDELRYPETKFYSEEEAIEAVVSAIMDEMKEDLEQYENHEIDYIQLMERHSYLTFSLLLYKERFEKQSVTNCNELEDIQSEGM